LRINIIIISIIYLIIAYYDSNLIFHPRETYVRLIESARNEGGTSYTFLSAAGAILSNASIWFPYIIIVLPLVYLIGSKGLVVHSIIVFALSVIYRNNNKKAGLRKSAIFISTFGFLILIFYFTMNAMVAGNDDALLYLFTSYFDYIYNLNEILIFASIYPSQHWEFVINDFIPGYARVMGVDRSDFFFHYFPYESSFGKFPGLLDYENFIRLGGVLFLIYYFFKLILIGLFSIICFKLKLKISFAFILLTSFSVKIVVILMIMELFFRILNLFLSAISKKRCNTLQKI
jgi:hypothetical protein